MHRPTFLSKYDALSKLFFQLTEELDRAVTDMGVENYVIQPKGVATDPGTVPDLLRTKLEPEIERDVDTLAQQYRDDVGENNATPEQIAKRISTFNSFVQQTVEQIQDLKEDLVTPQIPEQKPKRPPPAADAILAAIATGAGLKR